MRSSWQGAAATSDLLAAPVLAETRRWERTAGAAAVTLAAIVLYARDPAEDGSYPLCPLNATTGLYCPGCGTLRALHQLLHGRLDRSLALNPLTVLAVPFLAYHFAVWLLPSLGWRRVAPSGRATWALLLVVVGFGILRNLPLAPFDALAP